MQTLRLFCDVANCHSFSQAAGKHGITQSAVSQRVSQLEKHLGVKLIDRSVRPLELTEQGQLFLRGCMDLLDRYDRLEQQVVEHAGGTRSDNPGEIESDLRGEIVVDAIYSAGIDLLHEAKQEFEARWPRAKVIVEFKHPEAVHEAVRLRQCDLGIVSYPDGWRDVQSMELRQERMALICQPEHRLAGEPRVDASQLKDQAMASFEASLPVGRQIKQYLKQHGVNQPFTNVFDNLDTIKSVVAQTDQVAILPLRTVRRELAAGTLAAVTLEPALERPMGLIYRKALSQVTLAFVELLKRRVHSEAAASNGRDGATTKIDPFAKQDGDAKPNEGRLREVV